MSHNLPWGCRRTSQRLCQCAGERPARSESWPSHRSVWVAGGSRPARVFPASRDRTGILLGGRGRSGLISQPLWKRAVAVPKRSGQKGTGGSRRRSPLPAERAVSPGRAQPPSLTLLAGPLAKEGGSGRGLSRWTRLSHELRPSRRRQGPVCLRHNTGPVTFGWTVLGTPCCRAGSDPRAAVKLTAHRPLPGRPTAGAHCAGPRGPGPFAQDPEQGLGNADCSPSDPDTRLAEPAHPDLTVLTPALGAASATGDRGHTTACILGETPASSTPGHTLSAASACHLGVHSA